MLLACLVVLLIIDNAFAEAGGALNFLVMGDWGGQPSSPYTTKAETATAKGMGKLAASLGAPFTLALGDNFYNTGVPNVESHRFKDTFENVFSADSLQHPFSFKVVAGNHDHNGNVSAQISYSTKSERWHFPSEYYTFSEASKDGATVQFVMIDTVLLCGNSEIDGLDRELHGSELRGPEDVRAAESQMQWINDTLAAAQDADYVIVAGHYPVYSICEHGPTQCLITQLKPLLEHYKVSAYFNGHDHCAEFIDIGDGVQYHTIGSAHLNDPSTGHKSTVSSEQLKFHTGKGDGGFSSVAMSKDGMTVKHYDGDGKLLFTAPNVAPRK